MTDGMLLALVCAIALIVLLPFFIVIAMTSRALYRLKRIDDLLSRLVSKKELVEDHSRDQ
jgi:hypothetical protein